MKNEEWVNEEWRMKNEEWVNEELRMKNEEFATALIIVFLTR